jgi:hypothetical protein
MRSLLASSLVACLLVGGWTANLAAYGGSPLPQAAVAQLHGDLLILQEKQTQYVHETKTRAVEVAGKTEYQTYTVSRSVAVRMERAIGPDDYRVFDVAGNRLAAATVAARLAAATPVLISNGSTKVEPKFLEVFKPETLLIYLRPAPAPAYYPSPVAPSPVASPTPGSAPPGPTVNPSPSGTAPAPHPTPSAANSPS